MLIEQAGGIVDWIRSIFSTLLEPGWSFCVGLIVGAVLGCLISLSALIGLKMDENLENFNDSKRGDGE